MRTSERATGVASPPRVRTPGRETPHGSSDNGWLAHRLPDWARRPLLWLEFAFGVYLLAVSASAMSGPLDRDEGAFLTIARVVLHGGLPYRDAFDQKSPAIYYLLAALLAVTSWLSPVAQVLALRVVVVLVNLATAWGLVLLGRRWWSLEVGVLGAGLWLLGMPIFQGDHFFTEPFAVAATVYALVVAVSFPTPRGALLAGLLLAVGSLFKQTTVLAVPGVALLLLPDWRGDRRWWRPSSVVLGRLGLFAAGLIAPWLLMGGAFALAGGLGPMWQQVVVNNLTHYPSRYPEDGTLLTRLTLGLKRLPPIWIAPAALALAGVARWIGWWPGAPEEHGQQGRRGQAPSPASVALWLMMLLAALPFATHSYAHYWLQLLPSAALLTALALCSLLDITRLLTWDSAQVSLALRLLAPTLLVGILMVVWVHPFPPARFGVLAHQLQGQADAGQVVAAHTAPGERIFVMPAEAEFYYLSNRMPATSTIYVQVINLTPTLVSSIEADIDADHYGAVVWIRGPFNTWPEMIAIYHEITTHYHLVATDPAWGVEVWLPNATSS